MKRTITLFVAVLLATMAMAQINTRTFKNGNPGSLKATSIERHQSGKYHHAQGGRKTVTNITAVSFQSEYYSSDNDWYCLLTDANEDYQFYFDIVATTLVPGTTYTLTDMLTDYSYGYDNTTYDEIEYDSASFTLTYVSGRMHISARVVDVNGDVWVITYDEFDPTQATDTIALACTSVELIDYTSIMGAFQFYGTDSTYEVYVAANSNQVAGTYTTADFMTGNTLLTYDMDDYAFLAGNMTVTASAAGYDVDAYLVFSDYHCYHITMFYSDSTAGGGDTTIVVGDTIDLNYTAEQTSLTDYRDLYGAFMFLGQSTEAQTILTIMSNTIPGNFTSELLAEGCGITFHGTEETIMGVSGHANITQTDNGYYLESYMVFDDGNCYHITMNYGTPEAVDTIDINFTSAETSLDDATEEEGFFQFYGEKSDLLAIISIQSSTIEGTFEDEIFAAGTALGFVSGADTTIAMFHSGNVTVTATENGYRLEGYLLMQNSHCYHITMETGEGGGGEEPQGIEMADQVRLNVYPNPTSDQLNIQAEGMKSVCLLDLNGREVLSQNGTTLDMSALPNGVYFVRVITANGIATQKVVKK